jgi:hypothetical protein
MSIYILSRLFLRRTNRRCPDQTPCLPFALTQLRCLSPPFPRALRRFSAAKCIEHSSRDLFSAQTFLTAATGLITHVLLLEGKKSGMTAGGQVFSAGWSLVPGCCVHEDAD